jgi:hypothetical protein
MTAAIAHAAHVAAELAALAGCPDAELFSLYSDLYKDDYGVRPVGAPREQMELWIAERPDRACGYQDPEQYAEELEWLAECAAQDAAETAAERSAVSRAYRLAEADWDVSAGGRVSFYA